MMLIKMAKNKKNMVLPYLRFMVYEVVGPVNLGEGVEDTHRNRIKYAESLGFATSNNPMRNFKEKDNGTEDT